MTKLLAALTAAFFAAFFLWPIFQILKGGFIDADGHLTFAYFTALLADPTYRDGLKNSFLLACATTTLAVGIALPLAFISDRFVFPAKAALGWSTGAHGLRHAYAQERVTELQTLEHSQKVANETVSQELGHFRPEITTTYLR